MREVRLMACTFEDALHWKTQELGEPWNRARAAHFQDQLWLVTDYARAKTPPGFVLAKIDPGLQFFAWYIAE